MAHTLPPTSKKHPKKDLKWHFTCLLMDGWPILKAAKRSGIARRTAYRWAQIAVDKKQIELACIWPKLFRKTTKSGTQPRLVGNVPLSDGTDPLFIPHRYGGVFMTSGRPKGLIYDARGGARIKEGSHTAQFGRRKVILWVKHYRGNGVKEILANAYEDLMRFAGYYGKKFGITLTLTRVFNGVEWVLVERETGEKLNNMCEIHPQKEIAGTTFKFDDASHPGMLEINQAQGQPAHLPTQHAHTLEYLLLYAPSLLEKMVKSIDALNKRLEEEKK